MATVTVVTESYVDLSDDDDPGLAEEIVKAALSTQGSIYLVKVTREGVLLER